MRKIALAFPVDWLLPFPVAIEELHASLDKAVRAKEFISHQVVLACSKSPAELQTNHCQFWQRANCWPTHFPESWGVTRVRCSRRRLPALFAYSCTKVLFNTTRTATRCSCDPRTLCCFVWYFELFNRGDWYSHWHRNSAYTPWNSELWQRLLAFTARV